MLGALSQDYVRTARAKGLSEKFVVGKHALRNALIPVVTLGTIEFGRLLAGAVLTGAALAAGGVIADQGFVYPVLYALVGAALHIGTFGLDPMADKGMDGIDAFQTTRVAHAVEAGEAHLRAMQDAILRAVTGRWNGGSTSSPPPPAACSAPSRLIPAT